MVVTPKPKVIYLDNAATTSCDPDVMAEMYPYFTDVYGNPSSTHVYGRLSQNVIKRCRDSIARLLGAHDGEVYFTSGATESNNIATYSLARYVRERLNRRKILCLATEHKSVLTSISYFAQLFELEVDLIPVNTDGTLNEEWLRRNLGEEVGALIVQLANSETGVIQNLEMISEQAHQIGALVFSDITQAVCRTLVDLSKLQVDFASISAHKFHGPKGIGALYVRKKAEVAPIAYGGGQESTVRPGTENVPGVVGLAKALQLGMDNLESNVDKLLRLRDSLWVSLSEFHGIKWNGREVSILPSHLNITIDNVNAQDLMLRLRRVAFSAGSACNAASHLPSPVLLSMGLSAQEAEQTIRLTVSRLNTEQEIDEAASLLKEAIHSIRNESGK